MNETNQINQINETNQTNEIDEIASRRGRVELIPQDMVARSLFDIDLSSAPNGNPGQAPSPYNPKYLLKKMPYRFNTSYRLLAHSSAFVPCDWFLSLGLLRSQP